MNKKKHQRSGTKPQNGTAIQRVLRTREECRAYYNKLSRAYDMLADRAEAPLREKGLDLLAPAPGERVLEVGTGTGHSLAELARAVSEQGLAIGVDLSEGMTVQARGRLDRMGLTKSALVACGDALRAAGFRVKREVLAHMWVPVEIVLATYP